MKWEFDEVGVRRSSPPVSPVPYGEGGVALLPRQPYDAAVAGGVRQEPGPGIAALRVPGGAAGRVARGERDVETLRRAVQKAAAKGLGANVADFPDGPFDSSVLPVATPPSGAPAALACGPFLFGQKQAPGLAVPPARAARAARAAGGGLRKRTYKGRPQSNQQHRKSTEQYVKHC